MTSGIDKRESRVMDFIQAQTKENEKSNMMANIEASPEIKLRKLNSEAKKGVSICIDNILASIYKDALPFNDPKKNCSIDDASVGIHNYISNRTGGKDSEYYIREAIRKNNSSLLRNILSEATSISKLFYNEKAKDIGKISISDLNFNIKNKDETLSKITKNLELDEISDIIRDNVEKTIKDEAEKAKREEEYSKALEDRLVQDTDVTDDASMESAIEKYSIITQPIVYQPSLFESIMLGKTKIMTESTMDDIFSEAVHELTKLNMTKALKLESFSVDSIKKLANSYIA